jgi:hypothetical protein
LEALLDGGVAGSKGVAEDFLAVFVHGPDQRRAVQLRWLVRERYASKMDGPERNAFDIVASGERQNPKMVREVAKTLSALDSLNLFIKLYRARFPDKPLSPDTTPTAAIASPLSTR